MAFYVYTNFVFQDCNKLILNSFEEPFSQIGGEDAPPLMEWTECSDSQTVTPTWWKWEDWDEDLEDQYFYGGATSTSEGCLDLS